MNFSPDYIFDAIFYLNTMNRAWEAGIRQVFKDVWTKIPNLDKPKLSGYLEFIVSKPIVNSIASKDPGITVLSPSGQCLIILNSIYFINNQDLENHLEHDTLVYSLAHELAHVYFNHPVKMNEFIKQNNPATIQAQKEKDENQAYDKAHEWGFTPDHKDHEKLPAYNTWLASKNS